MIPMPTKFGELRSRSTGPWSGAWIVKITSKDAFGFDQIIYVSDTDMQLGADHVYGFLESVGEFGRGLDIYKLTYNAARAVITLSDRHYHRTSSTIPARLSDKFPMVPTVGGDYKGLHHATVELLIYPGSYATLIADCLSVYQGVVTRYTAQDEKLIIYTDERRKVVHRDLPQRKFTRTLFPKMPAETENETMPLVYGPHNELAELRNTGFVPCKRIEEWKWLVSDHVLDNFYDEPRPSSATDGSAYSSTTKAIFIYIRELESFARSYTGVTFTANDGGRATIQIDPDNAGFDVLLYPASGVLTSTGSDPANLLGPLAVVDNDLNTKVSVLANSTTQAEITFEWRQNGSDVDHITQNGLASLTAPGSPVLEGIDLYCSKPGGVTITSSSIEVWDGSTWITVATSVNTSTANMIHYDFPGAYLWTDTITNNGIFWHLGTGGTGGDGKPFKVRIRFNGSGWTANSTVVAYIHECRLVKSCALPNSFVNVVGYRPIDVNAQGTLGGRVTVPVIKLEKITEGADVLVGASVQGREYGSWIDLGGRSNSHNSGDQIATAPGIVESLLRDELGVATADIDMPSFDAALTDATYNRAAKMHLKSGARQNSKNVIERLCWEHGMALVHRPNGQLRLIRIPGSGELVATLLPDDIFEQVPTIDTTDVAIIRNELTLYYNRMADSGKYLRSLVVTPTSGASVARYGTIPDEFQLQSHSDITSTNKAIYDYLLDAYGILSRPHMIVKFTARGFRFAHAELGDHFQFAPLETREIRQRFGQSWGSADLMIYDMLYKSNGIQFTCIKWTPE